MVQKYDTNAKKRKVANNAKNAKKITQMRSFLQNEKNNIWKRKYIPVFCVITFEPIKFLTCSAPQNDRLNFSFVKDIHVVGEHTARNGHLSVTNLMHHPLYNSVRTPSVKTSHVFLLKALKRLSSWSIFTWNALHVYR